MHTTMGEGGEAAMQFVSSKTLPDYKTATEAKFVSGLKPPYISRQHKQFWCKISFRLPFAWLYGVSELDFYS